MGAWANWQSLLLQTECNIESSSLSAPTNTSVYVSTGQPLRTVTWFVEATKQHMPDRGIGPLCTVSIVWQKISDYGIAYPIRYNQSWFNRQRIGTIHARLAQG